MVRRLVARAQRVMGTNADQSATRSTPSSHDRDRRRCTSSPACRVRSSNSLDYEPVTRWSVLVVVITVGRMPAPVMHVVDVIAMRDGHVTASLTVNVVMSLMDDVTVGGFAFVVVIVVASVKMPAVRVVDVLAVRDRDMPAALAVMVVVTEVLMVSGSAHCCSSRLPGPMTMASRLSC